MAKAKLLANTIKPEGSTGTKKTTWRIEPANSLTYQHKDGNVIIGKKPIPKKTTSNLQDIRLDLYCTADALYRWLKRYHNAKLIEYYKPKIEKSKSNITIYNAFMQDALTFNLEDFIQNHIGLFYAIDDITDLEDRIIIIMRAYTLNTREKYRDRYEPPPRVR